MRCQWCNSNLIFRVKEVPHKWEPGFMCLMCNRSNDWEYEATIKKIRDLESIGLIKFRAWNYYGPHEEIPFDWLNK